MRVKKQNVQKMCNKRKLEFEDYKNCLRVSQLENQSRKNKTNTNSLIENHNSFIKNNEVILKTNSIVFIRNTLIRPL